MADKFTGFKDIFAKTGSNAGRVPLDHSDIFLCRRALELLAKELGKEANRAKDPAARQRALEAQVRARTLARTLVGGEALDVDDLTGMEVD